MKRFVFLALMLTTVAASRTLKAQQLSFGVKIGPQVSSLAVDDGIGKYSAAVGFHGGAFVIYKVSELSWEADVLYSFQGAKIKADGEYLKANVNYINVPIVARYEILPSVSVHLGPQIGFLSCVKSDYHPITKEPFDEQHYTKAYKKIDYGVIIGAGYEPGRCVIDLRYFLGLNDIADYEGLAETKNRVLQLSVGFKIFRTKI
jgi:hypothetical protein